MVFIFETLFTFPPNILILTNKMYINKKRESKKLI